MPAFDFTKVKTRENEYKQEVILLEADKLAQLRTKDFIKTWSKDAYQQLLDKLKDFKIAEEPPFKSIRIGFDSGRSVVVLPLPDCKTFDMHQSVRDALGSLVKADSGEKTLVDISLAKKTLQEKWIAAIASLSTLEGWKQPKYVKKKDDKPSKKSTLHYLTALTSQELKNLIDEQVSLSESTNLVRILAETPGNYLKPDQYRELVKKRAKDLGYEFSFFGIKDLEKLGAGSYLSVTKGDPDDLGGIVKLHYKPKSKSPRKVALVGKGVCFDTGGYNIKTGAYMHGMHRDMTGSAVTLALFEHLSAMKVNFEVTAYLALAENLISPHANRPNDLVFASNGMSIEMVDTDAEGRLILADTLAIASKEKPALILDFATLTGSAVQSLDTRRAAIFSNNIKLLKAGFDAGEASGERTWGFPIGEDYFKKLKSDIADIRQCATGRNADHIYAATFLSKFVAEGVNWVHMDLCPDTNAGGLGLVKSETTGFGVRWGYELLTNFWK